MGRKALWLFALFSLMFVNGGASSLSFKIFGGMSWIGGGDLNRNLRGWKNYFNDRYQPPYSFNYNVKELHRFWESGLEINYSLSSRLGIGLGFEFITGAIKGEMSSSLEYEKNYFNSAHDFGTIFLEEKTLRQPRYHLKTMPVTLTLYYSFPVGARGNLSVGWGGGYYWGKLEYRENYQYDFDYRDENTLSGSLLSFIDRYSSSGIYSEGSTSSALGLHSKTSLEIKIHKGLKFFFEVLERWVDFKNWQGSKRDSYSWNHTWGFWGENMDKGSAEEITKGKLWMVEFQSEENGKSYPRFVFSEKKPLSSSYLEPRPAQINLNGVCLRIGIRVSI